MTVIFWQFHQFKYGIPIVILILILLYVLTLKENNFQDKTWNIFLHVEINNRFNTESIVPISGSCKPYTFLTVHGCKQ